VSPATGKRGDFTFTARLFKIENTSFVMVSFRLAAGVLPKVLKIVRCEKSTFENSTRDLIGTHTGVEDDSRNVLEGLARFGQIRDLLFQ
jgi:hypothetical protein